MGLIQGATQASDLSLLRSKASDLVSGLLARQDAGVAQLAPLRDLGRVQPLPSQIGTALTASAGGLILGQVLQLLSRRE